MSIIRLFAVTALLIIGTAVPSYSQQSWLIGTWKGMLDGLPASNRYGADRTLTVTAVDGSSAKAQWIGPQLTQTVTVSINGNDISFSSPGSSGATYKMTLKGNSLEGFWTSSGSGKGGSISLKKQ